MDNENSNLWVARATIAHVEKHTQRIGLCVLGNLNSKYETKEATMKLLHGTDSCFDHIGFISCVLLLGFFSVNESQQNTVSSHILKKQNPFSHA